MPLRLLPYYFLLTTLLLLAGTAGAEITLPKVLGSNMVLQRGKPLPIWGKAAAGESVTVRFGKQTKRTVADAAGDWKVLLNPLSPSATPAQMVVMGRDTITLTNILVGEVWLCSGQSNMEYTMSKSSKYANAVRSKGLDAEALAKEQNGNIRLFLVKRDLNKGGDINKGWNEAGGEALRAFSAAGYFFAKKLHQELNIPIGVISSAIPGSAIEPWMAGTPSFQDTGNQPRLLLDEQKPGKFYPTMIAPLAPFALKGFLWYQGETNCFGAETVEYTLKLKELISSWRELWKDETLPFYYVQLAPFLYSKSKDHTALTEETLPLFREAQAAASEVPHTGMIVTTDLVDKLDDIHPTYKWEIGSRLALVALAKTYGKKVAYSGPVFKELKVIGNKAEISFDGVGSGLVSRDGKPLTWFFIAGADGVFHPATALVKGNKIILSCESVTNPMHIRFAWNEAAQSNFCNGEGLPAVPFRTDKITKQNTAFSANKNSTVRN